MNRLLRHGLWVLWAVALSAHALPTFPEVKAAYTESSAWLLDSSGQPLQVLRLDKSVRRYGWTRLEQVSPALRRALLFSEDRNFYAHAGIDWNAVAVSAWRNVWNSRTRGASTLTMQLAGLLAEADSGQVRKGRRNVLEKLDQAATALRLEQAWRKDQILEAYLNLASFRGELQGVAAMSRGLFGKWPEGLTEREAALAAALLRAPNAPAAQVSSRACGILQEMGRASECAGLEGFAVAALGGVLRDGEGGLGAAPQLAPHLARRLLTRPGQRLTSTVLGPLQAFANGSLQEQLRRLARQNAEDGAVVVLDNATGAVLAWVGSSGRLSDAAQVDGVVALRQAGSTLKPFLYGRALERRYLTAASLIEDSSLTLTTANGLYAPQNYEPHYRGWVSARHALAGSLNVPAVRTLVRVGTDDFYELLRRFGFDSLRDGPDFYGYSLALGSADISLLALANAYRTLANGGRWSPVHAVRGRGGIANAANADEAWPLGRAVPRQVLGAAASFVVADMLADRSARAGTFGLESWLSTPYWSAVKTGTSKDMRDNWCAGFSRRYTVAVWVGNAAGEPMHDVSGVSGAAPVWRAVMDWLHRGDPATGRVGVRSEPPSAPPGVLRQWVRFDPPSEPARQEWFLAGTERAVIRSVTGSAVDGGRNGAGELARIAYPSDGTVLALDPDIPPERQRVSLRVSAPARGWDWWLDGKRLMPVATGSETLWRPTPGRHRLALANGAGQEQDAVNIEIRALKGNTGTSAARKSPQNH